MQNDRKHTKRLIILVGCPGSGKSTIASLFKGALVLSADSFRMKDGVYTYKKSENYKVFGMVDDEFRKALKRGRKLIVIDNTNVSSGLCANYIDEAFEAGYEVTKLFIPRSFEECAERNIHKVPRKTLHYMHQAMRDHFTYAMAFSVDRRKWLSAWAKLEKKLKRVRSSDGKSK